MEYSPTLETLKLNNYGIMLATDFNLIKDKVNNKNVIHLEYRGKENIKIVVYHNFNQVVNIAKNNNINFISNISDLLEVKKEVDLLCEGEGDLYERESTCFNKAYYYARNKIPYMWKKIL